MDWNPVNHRIFETLSGSWMYGTSTPASDTDYRGICIPPKEILLDPFHGFEQKDSGFDEEDRTIYALSKFMKLCADASPNIIELLFAPKECWIYHNEKWLYLLEHRHLFLSKKVRYTFSGYAASQLNDIKRHRKWFIDPPKEKPTRRMYGLTDSPKVSGEGLQAISNVSFDVLDEKFRDEIKRELDYRATKQAWDNYQSWFKNRNPKRKELEEKYGYDTKHASHLFRLMSEGKDLLLNGHVEFPLRNSEEILEIKNGKYTYDQVIEMAECLDAEFDKWYVASELPHSPDWKKIKKLYFELIG